MARKKLIKKLHRLHDLFRGVVDLLRRKRKKRRGEEGALSQGIANSFRCQCLKCLDIIEADKNS
ncbi:Hypothetical protein FKW44_003494 [Caligus rogercresseyi]|uniref:Uncharacterized protein n=1 Tax=Caligus rogercresseyi TaxID=217165 RepID=A0A7T8KLQ1_CALRO|nr:Hypothetical protein FKW44_003494 [Caligus rogercresseyi]